MKKRLYFISVLVLGLGVFIFFSGNKTQSAGTSEMLLIPSLNVAVSIIYVDSMNNDDIENALYSAAVHQKGSAIPGNVGNAQIMGSYNNIFHNLLNINVGESVLVQRDNGKTLVFEVIDKNISSSHDLNSLNLKNDKRRLLTLTTTDPIGTGNLQYFVVAELK